MQVRNLTLLAEFSDYGEWYVMEESSYNEDNIIGSPIQEFFRGKTVFLTGGTGFMGKILIEKILRCCPHVSRIYMLVRQKKNKDFQQRMHEYVEDEIFHKLNAKARLKVTGIPGDVAQPRLGISNEHRKLLEDSVNIVFHAAATVRFDEQLPTAVAINVAGTKELFDLARNMRHLKALVHVSTAFSNCQLDEIREEIYEPPTTHQKLIQLTQSIEGKFLNEITPIILDKRPNTYVYTKAVAEEVVRTLSKGLPVSIFRPAIGKKSSILQLYWNLPIEIDFLESYMKSHLSLIRKAYPHNITGNTTQHYLVVCLQLIIFFHRTIEDSNQNENEPAEEVVHEEPTVYNYVSSTQRPITWKQFSELAVTHGEECPPTQSLWCFCLTLNKYFLIHYLYVLFLHFLPAIVMDGIAMVFGKKAGMMGIYKKVNKFSEVLSYFTTRDFAFHNDNVQSLWRILSPQDKEMFPFDLSSLDWDEYFHYYVRGVRKYLMKEDPATIPQAMNKYKKFKFLHRALKLVIAFLLLRLLWTNLVPIFLRVSVH
ncbi:fatty acyl-CoA reductase wat [Nilaparvata lugens]|uniref:fatty acyl-CoA reductase wat n=1 Tax=Nilaparvata lugens TaxID=108931 RepID=UPI00193D9E06|nr:fatty acyl-CoA reductase wat [Nilaparvata lugens]